MSWGVVAVIAVSLAVVVGVVVYLVNRHESEEAPINAP